jgi:hypothetical protein
MEPLFDIHTDIDLLSREWLQRQPLFEITVPQANRYLSEAGRQQHSVKVHEQSSIASRQVAQLKPRTLIRVLDTFEYVYESSTSLRALVVLNRSHRPLGWLTAKTGGGESIIQLFARPIYEVKLEAKIGHLCQHSLLASTGTLALATKVHILQNQRAKNGGHRALVRILGDLSPVGWVTATKPDGTKILQEVHEAANIVEMYEAQLRPALSPRAISPPHTSSTNATSPQLLSARTPPSERGTSARLTSAPSARSSSHVASARPSSPASFARPTPPLSSSRKVLQQRELQEPKGSARTPSPRTARGSNPQACRSRARSVELASSPLVTIVGREPELSAKSLALVGLWRRGLGGVTKHMGSAKGGQILERAVEDVLRRRHDRFLSADALRDEALGLQKDAIKEEKKLVKQTDAKLVEHFAKLLESQGEGALNGLLQSWDEIRKGKISRNQFAVCVRKIISMSDSQVNDLFDRYAEYNKADKLAEKPMEIDMSELQSGVRKHIDASASERANLKTLRERCESWRAHASIAISAAEVTDLLDKADDEVEKLKQEVTIGTKIGSMLIKRAMEPALAAEMWADPQGGVVRFEEFANNIKVLGVSAEPAEIDELFDKIDKDQSGLLDKHKLKNALSAFEMMAREHTKRGKALYTQVLNTFNDVRIAQNEYIISSRRNLKEHHRDPPSCLRGRVDSSYE